MGVKVALCGSALVFLLSFGATAIADAVQPELSVTKSHYLIGEPVSLTFTWTNVTGEQVDFGVRVAAERSKLLYSIDGQEFLEFVWLGGFVSRHGPPDIDGDVAYIEVPLAPGESHHFTTFVVGGVVHGTDKQLLLSRPGRYTLRAGKNDKPGASVDVAVPTRQQDIRAYEEWKRQVAARVALGPWYSTQDLDGLAQFAADYPDSVYAQYARLAIARHLVEGDMYRDTEKVRAKAIAYLRALVRDENPAIREHALWLNAQARRVTGKECERILREILQVNPKSEYADVLWRIVHPFSKRPPQPGEAVEEQPSGTEPKATKPVPLDLDRRSLADLPPGAAALLERYQTAIANRDVEGALACLSGEFVGNYGARKADVRRHWEFSFRSAHQRKILKQLGFRVEGFHRAASYERPADDQGKTVRFDGDLLIVRVRSTTETIVEPFVTEMTFVLKRLDGDAWTIVSSHSKSSTSPPRKSDGAEGK